MSYSSPPSSASSNSSYKRKTTRVLEKAYESASSMAKENSGRNRGIAAGTAAAFISLGLDKLNGDNDKEYTEAEIEAIREMAELAAEDQEGKPSKTSHFMDKLLDRVVKHTMHDGSIESEIIEQRINDTERTQRPGLSFRILASNFKKLSSKMTGFFAIQYGLIHIVTWKNPTKTLCFLFAYTSICLWPHLVLAYPLLGVLFGVMIPGYVYCHPMPNPELIKVKKRGQSIWEFFTDSDGSIVDDLLSDEFLEILEEKENYLKPLSSRSSDSSTFLSPFSSSSTSSSTPASSSLNTPEDVEKHQEKKESSKRIKKQVNLLMNMRDLQNLTTDLLKGMDKGEKFWYDTAGFKDEKVSTLIVYGLFTAVLIIVVLGQFIPWRLIFIQSGWSGILLCHPNSKKYLVALKPKKTRKPEAPQLPPRPEDKPPLPDRNKPALPPRPESQLKQEKPEASAKRPSHLEQLVIVDDEPEVRVVEVFELQYRSPTSNEFSFYNYSTSMFDVKDNKRAAGQRPVGVDHLSKVSPPQDWKFEMAFENTWIIDIYPDEFMKERGIMSRRKFVLKPGEEDGWIYDNSSEIPDLDYVFRRRRLYRECYRYGREPWRP